MKNKRMTKKKNKIGKMLIITVAALGLGGASYYLITRNNETNNDMTTVKPLVKPQRQGLTSKQLAESKNVAMTQDRPDGTYTLISVIEGADTNAKLSQSLNVINVQRKKLANLKQQFNILPMSAQQQRELIAGEINKTESVLKQNLSFMQANYAYNLNNQYFLLPEKARLVGAVDGKAEAVKSFNTYEEYETFTTLHRDYQVKLNNILLEWAKEQKPNDKGQKVIQPEELKELKKGDKELVKIAQKLSKDYEMNVDENYAVQFEKSALYVKTANAQ